MDRRVHGRLVVTAHGYLASRITAPRDIAQRYILQNLITPTRARPAATMSPSHETDIHDIDDSQHPHQDSYWKCAILIGVPIFLLTSVVATLITFTSQGYPTFIAGAWAFAVIASILAGLVGGGLLYDEERKTGDYHDQYVRHYRNSVKRYQETGLTKEQAYAIADTTIGRTPKCCRPRPG